MTFASESGHWYDAKTGEPRYEVQRADGNGLRPSTVRDARKHGWLPSVSGILKVADRPGLNNWMLDQAYLACLTLPRIDGESLDAFKARAKRDAGAQSESARNEGTRIHGVLEAVDRGSPIHRQDLPFVEGVRQQLAFVGMTGPWEAEKSFASRFGYGGKVDRHSREQNIVLDYKTKDDWESGAKLAYDEHALQLAAYAHGLNMPTAQLVNVFVSVKNPGKVFVHIWEPGDYFERFLCLLEYWQRKNGFAVAAMRAAA